MDQVTCCSCGADLGNVTARSAFISLFIAGDEEIRSWFWCAPCSVWTVQAYYDSFHGDSSIHTWGPVPKAQGDKIVALIATCPSPSDKWCECPAHQQLAPG